MSDSVIVILTHSSKNWNTLLMNKQPQYGTGYMFGRLFFENLFSSKDFVRKINDFC